MKGDHATSVPNLSQDVSSPVPSMSFFDKWNIFSTSKQGYKNCAVQVFVCSVSHCHGRFKGVADTKQSWNMWGIRALNEPLQNKQWQFLSVRKRQKTNRSANPDKQECTVFLCLHQREQTQSVLCGAITGHGKLFSPDLRKWPLKEILYPSSHQTKMRCKSAVKNLLSHSSRLSMYSTDAWNQLTYIYRSIYHTL